MRAINDLEENVAEWIDALCTGGPASDHCIAGLSGLVGDLLARALGMVSKEAERNQRVGEGAGCLYFNHNARGGIRRGKGSGSLRPGSGMCSLSRRQLDVPIGSGSP